MYFKLVITIINIIFFYNINLSAQEIKIKYKINNEIYDYLPFDEILQFKVEPIYVTLDGWQKSTYGIKNWKDLPKKAKDYILFIEELIETRISIISTGPERSETIDRDNILINI